MANINQLSNETILRGIAIIGSGYWGKNLVRNYHKIGALKLLCDKNEDQLAQFKKQYPNVDTCIAINDVISNDAIRGVVIATPAETHFTIAREALLGGKHVFVEKPLALNQKDGEELIEIAEKNKLIIMVGHLLQYHPAFKKLKDLVIKGELGRINYIYSHRLNLGKIRREENILWSFAPHDISMILALTGEMPETVSAHGGNYLHKKISDVTTTHLAFPSGKRAHVFVSWLHPYKEQKLVVVGDLKMAVFDDTKSWEEKLQLYPHQIKWENNMPIPDRKEAENIKIQEEEPLLLECIHFTDCIQSGKKPKTDGSEGLRVLKILNASQQSIVEEGKNVYLKDELKIDSSSHVKSIKKKQNYFCHSTAIIEEGCRIGRGTKIWHFSHILKDSNVGENCNIGQNVVIGPYVAIGKGCKIQNNVSIYEGVTLEDYVFCGPSMVFTNVFNPRAEISKMDQIRPTLVKTGTTLGANCTIVCGITIGRYALIGAGAVLNKDVKDYAIMVGNPGRQVGWVCQCGESLNKSLRCTVCEKRYKKNNENIILEKIDSIKY